MGSARMRTARTEPRNVRCNGVGVVQSKLVLSALTEQPLLTQLVIPGKTKYKYDLMTCLDVFSDTTAEKVSVSLNAKDHISCRK
jgi:hypothetical protein